MGNRAFVIFITNQGHSPAVYLHRNGGPESVYTALDALADSGQRVGDESYACARFVQLMGNYFGGTLSLGLRDAGSPESWPETLDHGDNGLYVIGWTGGRDYDVQHFLRGKPLSERALKTERARALKHEYNQDGSLLKQIRESNPAFIQNEASSFKSDSICTGDITSSGK